MDAPAAHRSRLLVVVSAALLVGVALGGCNGWFSQVSTTDGSQLSGISCPTTSTCFAVGATLSGQALVEETSDGGDNWAVLSSPAFDTPLRASHIDCPDADHCTAVGTDSPYGAQPVIALHTSDGGATWSSDVVTTTGADAGGIVCAGAATCWMTEDESAASSTTRVDITTDGGATWTTSAPVASTVPGTTNFGFSAIACPTSGECVAVAVGTYWNDSLPYPVPVGYSYLVSSSDGGDTWQEQQPLPDGGGGLACLSASRCLLGTYGGVDSVTTADAGATWTLQAAAVPGLNGTLSAISCPSSSHCVAVDHYDAAIYTSADGGATWASQPFSASGTGDGTVDPDAVSCPSATSCWVAGYTLPKTGLQVPDGSVVLHSVTGGVAWPSVSGISPTQGPAGGGTLVTIMGAGFMGSPTVSFGTGPGTVTATDVTVVSPQELQVVVPPCSCVPAPGGVPVAVTVSIPGLGASPPNFNDEFTYTNS